MFDSSHLGNSRDWSEIISWSMMDEELRWWFTLVHTPLISDGFSEVTLSTLGHTPLIDDIFFWDDVLHRGIVSSLLHLDYDGLAVVGWPYTGGVVVSESAFIGDTVTLLIDGWFLRSRFILRHNPLVSIGLWFSLEHSHFRWFILGHSHLIHIHIARGFWFIWTMMRCFHFWHQK